MRPFTYKRVARSQLTPSWTPLVRLSAMSIVGYRVLVLLAISQFLSALPPQRHPVQNSQKPHHQTAGTSLAQTSSNYNVLDPQIAQQPED